MSIYYKAFLVIAVLIQSWTTLIIPLTCASITSNITDLHSLLAFKAAVEFDPNNVLTNNWTSDTNFCDWYGVTCSKRRQRVTRLELFNLGLVGPISPRVGNLSFLTYLDLSNNSFHGQVVQELGHLSRLKTLYLNGNFFCGKLGVIDISGNRLTGMLPNNLTTLPSLRALYLGQNNLTGTIPRSFGNMSTLQGLALEENEFHDTILDEVALLPRLAILVLGKNYLEGTIPSSLFNISSLKMLALEYNSFTGDLPKDTSLQLPNLTQLFLGANQLTGTIPSHFYNTSRLTFLSIEENNFTGTLPATLPFSIQLLSASRCNLQGDIPKEIGTLKDLYLLDLSANRFSGTIPLEIKGLGNTQELILGNNELEGPFPEEICSLSNLGVLFLESNRFSGSIPECIGNLSGLQKFNLDNNRLERIPRSLWSLDQLVSLEISSNELHGDLGQNSTTMKSLNILDLSRNQLSGDIPDFLGSFQSLTYLDMSWNPFSGPIPESFGKLISLVTMNISKNNLSGQIPKSLEALRYLTHLNLSYNKLSGKIPTGGPFANFTSQSFIENQELCGEFLFKPCRGQGSKKSRNKLFFLSYVVPIIVVVLIVGALFYVSRKHKKHKLDQVPSSSLQEQRMISYHELSRATNMFSEANFLGSGGFGRVYKGVLSDGEVVAVKLLNLAVDGANKSFDVECKILRTVRHRNLVKVISTCTNPELRALILEYIPNGSLEKWLYAHNYYLTFLERVNIMLDVASAMDYLHCGLTELVIHCDLKPSNVLLDDDMVAHVGDFGIAKILVENKTETQTNTLGTLGYIAPEYGAEGRVSTKGDAFSYGVMLLETFTRKKPTDEMFSEDLSLRQWVSSMVPDGITDVVDENLLSAKPQKMS